MALNNVPLPGETLAHSRDLISDNFTVINADFLVDHVEYNLPGEGKHKHVTFTTQAGDSGAANEITLYNKSLGGQPCLYLNKMVNSGAINYIVPASDCILDITGGAPDVFGYTYLPSGIWLSWGQTNPPALGNTTCQLQAPMIAPHGLITVIIGRLYTAPNVTDTAYIRINAAAPRDHFDVHAYSPYAFNYLAIGY